MPIGEIKPDNKHYGRGRPKIDPLEMKDLIRRGKSTAQLALHFNCTENAIEKRKRQFQEEALEGTSEEPVKIFSGPIDSREQLQKAYAIINSVIDGNIVKYAGPHGVRNCVRWIRDEIDRAEQHDDGVENIPGLERAIEVLESKFVNKTSLVVIDPSLGLRASKEMREISRQNIELEGQITKMDEFHGFVETLFGVLEKEDPTLSQKVIAEWKKLNSGREVTALLKGK